MGSQLKTGVGRPPPPPHQSLACKPGKRSYRRKMSKRSLQPLPRRNCLLPLSCMPLCLRTDACGSADPPGFYPTGHKKQLTAPCSSIATKIAGAKYGSGQVKTFHKANPKSDSLLPNCPNLQPPYPNLYILLY